MQFSRQLIEDLKFRNSIEEVISSYVNLKKSGNRMIGLCPFHSEKTPSFCVYLENSHFYCFGCGAGGDVITFIERAENLSYVDAVYFLARRAGIQIENEKPDDTSFKLRERIFAANRAAAKFFYESLYNPEGTDARKYLKSRGLSEKTIRHFGIGFAPSGRFVMLDYLLNKGFTKEELSAANLIYLNKNGHGLSRFFNRIMFPIIDLKGMVIAFGGRAISNITPKYLNTSDTKVFKKGSNLFALNFAKNSKEDRFILTEGYMDVVTLHQSGITNAIATLGTALTISQAKVISRYKKEVVVCYDADDAGRKATDRAIPILRNEGLSVKVLVVPNGKDPDEFIKSAGTDGSLRFKKLIDNSRYDIEYKLNIASKNFDKTTSRGKIDFLSEAVKILSVLDNNIEQEVYASRLSEELGVEKSIIMQQVKKKKKKGPIDKKVINIQKNIFALNDKINPDKHKFLRAAVAEESLITHMIYCPEDVKDILKRLSPKDFCTDFNRRIYEKIIESVKRNQKVEVGDFSEDFSVEEMDRVTKFFVDGNSKFINKNSASEYIDVIISEKNKIKAEDGASLDLSEIMDYLKVLKDSKR